MRQEATLLYGAAVRSAILVLAAAALVGCGLKSTAPEADVTEAWIRLPAIPGRPASGYFRIEINGTRETLLSVSSPSARRIEMHMSVAENGRTGMRAVEEISTARARPILFEPGGNHLMLFGLDPSLRPGDTIELTFHFLLAPPVTARARAVGPGEGVPAHGGH